LGFFLSLIGVFVDQNKRPALIGLGLSALMVLLFFVTALC